MIPLYLSGSFYATIKVPLICQFQSELCEQHLLSVLSPQAIKRQHLYFSCEANLCKHSCLFPFVSLPLSSLRLREVNMLPSFLQVSLSVLSTKWEHSEPHCSLSIETQDNNDWLHSFGSIMVLFSLFSKSILGPSSLFPLALRWVRMMLNLDSTN